jgi:hypothetical protein
MNHIRLAGRSMRRRLSLSQWLGYRGRNGSAFNIEYGLNWHRGHSCGKADGV